MATGLSGAPQCVHQLHSAWSRPILAKDLPALLATPAVEGAAMTRDHLSNGAGLYIFTTTNGEPLPGNCLYIGKADENHHLRGRLGVYARQFQYAMAGRSGGFKVNGRLLAHFRAHLGSTWVRWVYVILAREYEGALIEAYQPTCNRRGENPSRYTKSILDEDDVPFLKG